MKLSEPSDKFDWQIKTSGQLLQQSVLSKRIRIKEFLSALDVAASSMDAKNYNKTARDGVPAAEKQ